MQTCRGISSHLCCIRHHVPVSACDDEFPAADLSQDFLGCVLGAAGEGAEPGKHKSQ